MRPGSTSVTRSTANSEQPFAGMQNAQKNVNGVSPFEGMPGAQNGLVNGMDYTQMMQMMPNGMQPNMMGTFPPFMGMLDARPSTIHSLTRHQLVCRQSEWTPCPQCMQDLEGREWEWE